MDGSLMRELRLALGEQCIPRQREVTQMDAFAVFRGFHPHCSKQILCLRSWVVG